MLAAFSRAKQVSVCVYIVFPSLECHKVTLERVRLHDIYTSV